MSAYKRIARASASLFSLRYGSKKTDGIIGFTDLLQVAQTLRAQFKPILHFCTGSWLATVANIALSLGGFADAAVASIAFKVGSKDRS